jgi:Zn-finger nucleic acid-binding protein
MDAVTLNCPTCGAAATTGAAQCAYCGARLATIACPSCFGLVFVGSRHCAHCGAGVARAEAPAAAPRRCPRACGELRTVALGGVELDECPRCSGVWVDDATFRRLCADRERQAVLLGAPAPAPRGGAATAAARVRYAPCPECRKLMNRVNFARASGVIVDVCKAHGVWFDEDELRRVVEFVRAGGLDWARERERQALAEERRLLELRQRVGTGHARAPEQGELRQPAADGALAAFFSLFVS